jgi:hypothetical protein
MEHGREGHGWEAFAAAVLAVFAALSGYFGNLASTEALVQKNEQIVATTKSSDTWAEYQASRIKYYLAQTPLDEGVKSDVLSKRAADEKSKGPDLKKEATRLHEQSIEHDTESKNLLVRHETLEVATTLFEIGIVLVSMAALVGKRLLPVAGVAAAIALVFFVRGLLMH